MGGQGQKLGNDFDRLGDLGGAFIKLVDDLTATELVKKHLAGVKYELVAIASDFNKIGEEFIKLAGPLETFDNVVVNFAEQFIKFTPSDGQTFPLADAFVKFENDIKATGLAFLDTALDLKSDAPTENLSFKFNKISQDYEAQSVDALSIKGEITDFLNISGISDSSELGMAFFKYAGDWQKISDAYLKLSADFQKIADDFLPTDGTAPLKFDQAVQKFASDFTALGEDLKLADATLRGLGGDFHKLADALQDAGPATPPTFKLS